MVDENQFKTIEKEIAKGTFMGSFKLCIEARKRLRKSVTIALEKGRKRNNLQRDTRDGKCFLR